ncbi:hypothetical protein PIB30_067227 [Stylosanthes scabra]|uniref:Uncharacterized protein n=1 Tax=Stylosanthes scabra TaxID=79078 RepID=A0ABU6TPY1_9FABA|nr:hypothetical protein [Stylosanthes scabra]
MEEGKDSYGAWMMVQRPKRGRRGHREEGNKTGEGTSKKIEKGSKSRFSVLQIEESTVEQIHEEEKNQEEQKLHKIEEPKGINTTNTKGDKDGMVKEKKKNQQSQEIRNTIEKRTNESTAVANTASKIPQENKHSNQTRSQTKENNKRNSQITRASHYKENWTEAKDATPTMMEEEVEASIQTSVKERKPPDPNLVNAEKGENMDTDIEENNPYQNLIEGVDFTIPERSGLQDTDMNMN